MRESVRRGLRLLGFILLVAGVIGVVLLFNPGPSRVAEKMGRSCGDDSGKHHQCDLLDALELLLIAPVLILIGGVMTLALRPPNRGPFTLDLSRRRDRPT